MEKTAKNTRRKSKKSDVKKAPKRSRLTKQNKSMNTYSSLVYKSRVRADKKSRKRAEELAELPKEPVKRFFARLHPKRVFRFIFSWRGVKAFLKFCAACILLGIIAIGGLFLYYKKDLEAIRLDELKISETVNTYLDRNGNLLWEDKGDEDYRLVVEGSEISTYMRQATVAIEDRNFYNHIGIDPWGLLRAAFSTLTGKGVQGGSTLTQQLIKQVYFSDEAKDRGLSGIPRKIKEAILAVEVEKMYDKEQIITMYLNESPYGGRRNGVESAAKTYFGKSSKDLTLDEAALLAAIPNNPGVLNPYNEYGHEMLLWRQQYTLDVMAELGYITAEEAAAAKEVDILAKIIPDSGNQYENIKAPHFVLEVKAQLEEKYGMKTMRSGGFTIITSLDLRAQEMAENAVATGNGLRYLNGSDDIALASVDVETGQVIAMVGSSDWNAPVYGQVNAATALVEPGSTIKPILDYGPLFMQRTGVNYGPGSILKDENIDRIYCAGYQGTCALRNASGAFYGNLTIRQSLGNSLNIPAVKALYINGIDSSLEIAHNLGDWSYCENNSAGGLSIAIGSGCNVKIIEHANAYASIARGGVYKELTYVLELKNSAGEILEKWEDTEGNRVYDAQVAYMLESILSDASARTTTFGSQATSFGFKIPNVWTGTKTGTTTTSNSSVTKDSLIASFSPVVATIVWNGNHDGSALKSNTNMIVRRVVNDYMSDVHLNLYEPEGKWVKNQAPEKPAGIQTLTVNGKTDIWPSWYSSKNSGVSTVKLVFNKYTHTLATECTKAEYKITVDATKSIDPISKQEVWYVPDPYQREVEDDCSYTPPSVNVYPASGANASGGVRVVIVKGSGKLTEYSVSVNGTVVQSGSVSATTINITEDTIKKGIAEPTTTEEDGDSTSSSNSSSSSATKTPVSVKVRVTVKDENGYEASNEL